MRIGITCHPVIGGSGVVASELGIALAEKGHQVHLISYDLPVRVDRFMENLYYHQVEFDSYPVFKYPPYTLALAAKLAEVAKTWTLDLLHAHYAIPHATCCYIAKQMLADPHLKVITTLHGTDITLVGSDKSFYGITKFSIESSDGVTCVSNYLKQEVCKEFQICAEPRVIYNFIDVDKYKPNGCSDFRQKLTARGEKVIIHMSNFRPLKRIKDVIDVFRLIRAGMPSKLLLIGEGPEITSARDRVAQYHLTDDVLFLGNQDKVEDILTVGDLFLLPSEHESFGLAALEALACGVPVIGTSHTGIPELVDDGKSGYVLELGDTETMAIRGLELLSDPEMHRQFSEHARKSVTTRFEKSMIVKQYESFYQEVMGGLSLGLQQ
ncbi:MAG: N-acetyl-alpha-D-glucosaminyl L-malate synthase BshA [candidate division Zixibacteria bacterium]|nr:N-acetyl-alpha-D-glucosaminyl L-malate synthase BshA [candidate division Zixibacteria bacterium]MBU1471817.1 N-acetyl-alpha-D-glucosaminyl L-malate synthase BshA [candidate division Zixibacteria bacterium]MBU2624845.1 N-acetyl-alpha-D-glucosaminyl L-malate synthase BshA [candidate division Zixibacteria bacterium]